MEKRKCGTQKKNFYANIYVKQLIITSLKLAGSEPESKKKMFSQKSSSHLVWSQNNLLMSLRTGPDGRKALVPNQSNINCKNVSNPLVSIRNSVCDSVYIQKSLANWRSWWIVEPVPLTWSWWMNGVKILMGDFILETEATGANPTFFQKVI